MKKQYYFVDQKKCAIAMEASSFDSVQNLDKVNLRKNNQSNIFWVYQKENLKKKGLIIHLDVFISSDPVKISHNGFLMLKEFKECWFGFFTNHELVSYQVLMNEKTDISEKVFRLFPPNLLRGIFSGMYKIKRKTALCLEVDKCFNAYKHLLQ